MDSTEAEQGQLKEPICGGCLCGAIRYKILEAPVMQFVCVCTDCQVVAGGLGLTSVIVPANSIQIDGEDQLTTFIKPDKPNLKRMFCSQCGTPVMGRSLKYPDLVGVTAGSLEDPSSFKPKQIIWCQSKPSYFSFPEGIPQFDQYPPTKEDD